MSYSDTVWTCPRCGERNTKEQDGHWCGFCKYNLLDLMSIEVLTGSVWTSRPATASSASEKTQPKTRRSLPDADGSADHGSVKNVTPATSRSG